MKSMLFARPARCQNRCTTNSGSPFALQVHEGFYQSWLSLAVKITQGVRELRRHYPDADLVLTGHSLGAAQVYGYLPLQL